MINGTHKYVQMGNEGAEAKEWHSLFVKGYRRLSAWTSCVCGWSHIGELRTASAVYMQVHIPIGVRENHVVNR